MNSINAKKLTDYGKYALGEILLVTIGILLAVQINAWHSAKEKEKDVEQLLTLVEEELISNIENYNEFAEFWLRKEPYTLAIIADTLTPEHYLNSKGLQQLFYGFDYEIKMDAFSQLIEARKDIHEEYNPLVNDLLFAYKHVMTDFLYFKNQLRDFYIEYTRNQVYNTALSQKYKNDIDYKVNDPQYRKLIKWHRSIYKGMVNNARIIQLYSIKSLTLLQSLKASNITDQMDLYITNLMEHIPGSGTHSLRSCEELDKPFAGNKDGYQLIKFHIVNKRDEPIILFYDQYDNKEYQSKRMNNPVCESKGITGHEDYLLNDVRYIIRNKAGDCLGWFNPEDYNAIYVVE
ncbi:MAG: hypothetical protein GC181_10130 [Bacteroidetes bacterium]|nr:hypothetical protein [Bacteroidota bacterium]